MNIDLRLQFIPVYDPHVLVFLDPDEVRVKVQQIVDQYIQEHSERFLGTGWKYIDTTQLPRE